MKQKETSIVSVRNSNRPCGLSVVMNSGYANCAYNNITQPAEISTCNHVVISNMWTFRISVIVLTRQRHAWKRLFFTPQPCAEGHTHTGVMSELVPGKKNASNAR